MLERMLKGFGLQAIWCHYGGKGVKAAGKRPLS
jgi:hypothetical protein